MAVKILSGWSNPGGSTLAHINLCNLFNENDIECIFYGPHDWHIDKCNGKLLVDADFAAEDSVIYHFLKYPDRPKFKNFVLSCHETNMYPIKDMNYQETDFIHYVSNSQRKWHSINHPYQIIPNVVPQLEESACSEHRAGVIGSIDRHKNTHVSIQRALDDGFKDVSLFGAVTDEGYFHEHIVPYIEDSNSGVLYQGYWDGNQEIYNHVDTVYHSSERETYNLIKVECAMAGVEYRGLESADTDGEYWEEYEILGKWCEALDL